MREPSSFPRILHHPLDLTLAVALLSLLHMPVLVAPVLVFAAEIAALPAAVLRRLKITKWRSGSYSLRPSHYFTGNLPPRVFALTRKPTIKVPRLCLTMRETVLKKRSVPTPRYLGDCHPFNEAMAAIAMPALAKHRLHSANGLNTLRIK